MQTTMMFSTQVIEDALRDPDMRAYLARVMFNYMYILSEGVHTQRKMKKRYVVPQIKTTRLLLFKRA